MLNDLKFTRVSNAVTAGTSAVDTSILDMAGFEGVIFVVLLNTVVDACVLTLTAQQNAANATSGMAAITGAATTPLTAATSSNGVIVLDVNKPQKEFVRAELTRTAQNATIDGIIAIQYAAGKRPTTQDTTVLASTFAIGA